MKGRESGMPQKEMWEGFFNPEKTLEIMELDRHVEDVAEFGCGYGTFTIPAARTAKGTIYAIDIESDMVRKTEMEARQKRLKNVKAVLRDFAAEGTGLSDESVHYVMLFNILHIENPEILLKESWRILREGGKLGIMHWNCNAETPRGPSMKIRPKPEQCIQWAKKAGFSHPQQYDLRPYHYGIVMRRE